MREREFILREIQRAAQENGGRPLGWRRFLAETGIRESEWLGRYWARWSDAVREAGFLPNSLQRPYEKDELLDKLAQLAIELGRLPNRGDLRFRAARDKTFPNSKTFARLGGMRQAVRLLASYCTGKPGYETVVDWCRSVLGDYDGRTPGDPPKREVVVGYVYLMKSGRYHKVGRSNSTGRREYEVGLQLPDPARLIHRISTDDPAGIEAYWHRRFADKHKNGEWYELAAGDITAFKRRRFM